MERRTSKVFKRWQTNEEVRRSIYEKPLAQGTAEDRVTAVNNEFRKLSLTDGVTVFDAEGNVVADLKSLLDHVKSVKTYLEKGHYLEDRNQYGVETFTVFLAWLVQNPHLDTYEKISVAVDDPDFDVMSLPIADQMYMKSSRGKAGHIRPNLKVGKLARLALETYLRNPDLQEVARLQNGEYCRRTFKMKRSLPVMKRMDDILNAPHGDRVGEFGFLDSHYWKATYIVDGVKYRLVNDWHELPNPVDNRSLLEDWIRRMGIVL